jgi:3-hydroxybutyryl-CoA dehydrogenase
MEITSETKVRIVGVGKVGMGMIQAFAQSGFRIIGVDLDMAAIDRGVKAVAGNLQELVSKGRVSADERDRILARMEFSTDLGAIKDAEVVIEAIFEEMDAKKGLFKTMDALVLSREALLLTNTSSLSISAIASVTSRPQFVAGMHFFNPVPVMKLVEVVRGALTSDATVEHVKALAGLLNKTAILSADSAGFIVNRLLNAVLCEAARIVEEGVGSVQDVDTGARLGLGHPMGPFQLMDFLNAIPLVGEVLECMKAELGERFNLPVWVKNLIRAGLVGRDSGRGFYDYSRKEVRVHESE